MKLNVITPPNGNKTDLKITLDQIDLFARTSDTTVSTPPAHATPTPASKPVSCQPHANYSVERLPNGYTRITQNGRVTFYGMIVGVKAA